MSTARSTLAVVAATAVSIVSFASLALPGHAQDTAVENAAASSQTGWQSRFRPPQRLNFDAFQSISSGMQASEVLATIGAPSAKIRFEATKTTAWDYHVRDPWNYDNDFSVIVDDAGVVVGKTRIRESG